MSTSPADAAADADGFIRVSTATKRYFGGAMSLRWWYRQIELGRRPHFRAGGTVLLRPADVEAFVGEGFRDRQAALADAAEETPPGVAVDAAPLAPRPKPRSGASRPGLRFFGD